MYLRLHSLDLSLLSKNLIRFIILILLQLLLLNNIHLSQLGITPQLYILFLILLPIETPRTLSLFFAFALGLAIDIPSDTGGLHTFSAVFLAFLRPGILNLLAPRSGYNSTSKPRVSIMGLGWFAKYAAVLICIHHIAFFLLEALSFSHLGITFAKIILTSTFTLFLALLSQFLIFRK